MEMLDARFGAYLIVATLLIVTPGPDTALVIKNALGSGWRASSMTAIGIALGSLVWEWLPCWASRSCSRSQRPRSRSSNWRALHTFYIWVSGPSPERFAMAK